MKRVFWMWRAIEMARSGLLRKQLSTFVDNLRATRECPNKFTIVQVLAERFVRAGGQLFRRTPGCPLGGCRFNGSFFIIVLLAFAPAAYAVDHNNIDAGRPLDFDDAEAIAYHERALDIGGAIGVTSGGDVNAAGALEFLDGFAPNTHLSVGIDPQYGRANGNANGGSRRFSSGDLSVGVLHNFNREYGKVPALGARVDAFLPTGRDSNGVDFRLRAIASRQFQQYARLHLNLDLNINNGADNNERKYLPGAILGYSRPLGYPTSFNRTLLAQVALRANPERGQSGIFNVGIGVRQQVTVDSVFDIGLSSDLTGGRERAALKLIAGYSKQF